MTDTLNALRAIQYQPRTPQDYQPAIGLIGCGGITSHHLKAYRAGGLNVIGLCDLRRSAAQARRDEFFPRAKVWDDASGLLSDERIQVVDITTHPQERAPLIEAALRAGKHVLSQKPFVLDLDEGDRLCQLAEELGLQLAVNQNGRWAPHFSFAREVVAAGLIGEVTGVHLSVHWDHGWVQGTPFENVAHLILYDYAIHWFDILGCLIKSPPRGVYATTARTTSQKIETPLLAQSLIEYDHAQASLAFDADLRAGAQDRSFIAGSQGAIRSTGPGNRKQQLVVETADAIYTPHLEGSWFSDGFLGTMGELLCAIEQQRTPSINARDNLRSLAVCFAAVESAKRRQPVKVGDVRSLPD